LKNKIKPIAFIFTAFNLKEAVEKYDFRNTYYNTDCLGNQLILFLKEEFFQYKFIITYKFSIVGESDV
jgi:hypothetical protein